MRILKKFFSGNTLYYPGCLSKFAAQDLVKNYKQILQWEGIDFVMLGDKEVCCGSPIRNAGAKQEFVRLARKNQKLFEAHGIGKIISNCPGCVATFRNDYPEVLGGQWQMETFHVTEVIDKSLAKFKKISSGTKATYHDPCHLGRRLGVYEQPRKIIQAAGYQLAEMDLSGRESFCCGGGGGVNSNNPALANQIAEDRIGQALQTDAEVLVTACPMCSVHLRNNQGKKIEVLELSQLFNFS